MKKHLLIALIAFGLGLGLTLMASTPSMAVHKGSGNLTCGNCHTMHSSQGGTSGASMGGDTGSFILLRNPNVTSRATIHNLCLQCHAQAGAQGGVVMNTGDGNANNNTTPPKVFLTSLGWTQDSTFEGIGAGGDFASVGTYTGGLFTLTGGDVDMALGKGHSLGISSPTPPGNNTAGNNSGAGTALSSFSCTSCHDPHGTNSTSSTINLYRNLKGGAPMGDNLAQRPMNQMSLNIASSYVGGANNGDNTQGTAPTADGNMWPVYRSSGTQNSYTVGAAPTSTLTVSDGSSYVQMSAFCAQCHGAWHEGFTSSTNKSGSDWARHPVDNRIEDGSLSSGAGVKITDFTHYSNNSIIPIGSKVPAADGAGSAVYYADNVGDKVFCLSCHFAHGSPYYDILRWDYISAVESGSQAGNGVASNKGCQQCHNR